MIDLYVIMPLVDEKGRLVIRTRRPFLGEILKKRKNCATIFKDYIRLRLVGRRTGLRPICCNT